MSINSIIKDVWSRFPEGKPPEVNPKFKDYHCLKISDHPWEKFHDINQDDYFGVDDMKARYRQVSDQPPIDENLERLNKKCRLILLGGISLKTFWLLREVVDGFKAGSLQRSEAVAKADAIKNEALRELETYRNEFKDHNMMGRSNCEVINIAAQAKEVINGEKDGFFGVGVGIIDYSSPQLGKGYTIAGTYPKGPAVDKLFRGDVITAIDGEKVGSAEMPIDADPATGLDYGFGGWYNSTVTFTAMRAENSETKEFDITLPRTTWTAEPINCGEPRHNWDGTEKDLNGEPVNTSSGCSASPATPTGRGFFGSLWHAGGNLGDWLYDVTH